MTHDRSRRGAPRWSLWLICALGLAGLVAALARAFPHAMVEPQDWANVAYLSGVLVLVTAGLFRAGRVFRPEHLRYLAIWSAIVAALALAYAYRAELGRALRLPSAPLPDVASERNA